MKRKKVLVIALFFTLGILLAACTGVSTTGSIKPTATDPKALRLVGTEPPNLDPQLSTDQVSISINNAVLEGLTRVYDGKILPGMADKWDVSSDGLTYTFHLRDAKWSDGKPVTAQDFEYSFKRLLDPNTAAEYAYQGYYILNGENFNTGKIKDAGEIGVKALDDKTLEVKLAMPCKYFLSLMSFLCYLPSRQDLVTQHKDAFASAPEKMAFNGPFILKEWNHDQNLTLEKNPNYWNKDAIKLDTVEFTVVQDSKTSMNLYEAGDIDMVAIAPDFVNKYKAEGKANFFLSGSVFYFEFNTKGRTPEIGKFLGNANFRKAIAYAFDRQAFCDAVLKNGSIPATRYMLPLMSGVEKKFTEEYPLNVYPAAADMAKAKEYLNKALAELGTTIDKVPAIEYLTDDSDTARIQAEAIQDMMTKALGIKLDIKQVQFKLRLELMKNSDYDIVAAGWGPDYDDPMTYLDLWITKGGLNGTGWGNSRYDELIKFAKNSNDPKARADAMFEAEKVLLEESPIVPLFFRQTAYAIQPYVKGMIRNFTGADPDFVFVDIEK